MAYITGMEMFIVSYIIFIIGLISIVLIIQINDLKLFLSHKNLTDAYEEFKRRRVYRRIINKYEKVRINLGDK